MNHGVRWLENTAVGASSHMVRQILSCIERKNGVVRICDLERGLHYSRRHLNRVFCAYTGIDAKRFCRYIRFQHTLACMRDNAGMGISAIAALCGHFDQRHLQKEFGEFAAGTPCRYRVTLKAGGYFEHLTLV